MTTTPRLPRLGTRKFIFLLVARSPCGDLHKIARAIPKGADLADGDILYYWETKSAHVETAVNRAERMLESLAEKTGTDWILDDDVTVKLADGSEKSFYIEDLS